MKTRSCSCSRSFTGSILLMIAAVTTLAGTTVLATVVVSSLPTAQTVCAPSVATFTVAATASWGNLLIQWQYSTDGGNTWNPTPDGGNNLSTVFHPTYTSENGFLIQVVLMDDGDFDEYYSTPVTLTVYAPPTVVTGPSQTICSSSATASLGGTVGGGATGGTWTTLGTGTFAPNATTLNASYTASAADSSTGTVTLTLTTTGQQAPCGAATAQVAVTINRAATASAGAAQTLCSGVASSGLGGTVGGGATGGTWTTSGTGAFAPNTTTLNASYTASTSDASTGTVTLTLTTTGQLSPCGAATATVTETVRKAATAIAGANQTVCAGLASAGLGGMVGGGATGGTWTSSGSGTFTPNATTLNASYTASTADASTGTVTLTLTSTGQSSPCGAVTVTVTETVRKAATVSAGAAQTVCSGVASSGLGGTVGGSATGGTWTTSGSGTFSPNATTLNASYTASAADASTGTVTLTLTATGQLAPCSAATAQVVVTVNPPETVYAGPNQTVCSSSPATQLAGSFGNGATGAVWSGAGSFSPSTTAMNAIYTPSAGEIAASSATVTLTSSPGAVSSTMTITINPAATANAGPNQTVCANNPATTLAGSFGGGATLAYWSGAGTFNLNIYQMNAIYTPTAAEIAAGTVTLTLTTTGQQAPCGAATAQVAVTINRAATASAGAAQTLCSGVASSGLGGTVGGGATGGTWTTSGTGTFAPNTTTLNASYTASTSDASTGTVTLTLTTTGQLSPCGAATATVTETVRKVATAIAGANQTVCAGLASAGLGGTVGGGATGGMWTTSGSGTFSPNATTLNASYTASVADASAGTVSLTLTTTGQQSPCAAAAATVAVIVRRAATASVGAAQTVCWGVASAGLGGTVGGGATGGTWTTSGTGTFAPNATTLNASYTASTADASTGTVTLTLTSTGQSPCEAATAQVVVTVLAVTPPTITGGPSSQCVWVGGNVSFSVAVVGSGPFTYQWRFNGTNLPTNIIFTAAGGGATSYLNADVRAADATLGWLDGGAFDSYGNLFIADSPWSAIARLGTNGIINRVAGNGNGLFGGDGGPATNATLHYPGAVALDRNNNLFIADSGNNRVRKVGTNGVITTIAGNGTNLYSGDGGPAINASLSAPGGVAVGADSSVFIADVGNSRIRRVDPTGVIATIAGGGPTLGDGGAATNAQLSSPYGITFDATGNLLIADWGNWRIRKVLTNGIITTVVGGGAGGGTNGLGDGGAATNATLAYPAGVTVDSFGNMFIADYGNQRVRKVDTNGIITTVAGNGTSGYSGDGGPATSAELESPWGTAVDASGNLFIAVHARIREVPVQGPSLTLVNANASSGGNYDLVVTGPYGSVTSSVASLAVLSSPLVSGAVRNTNGSVTISLWTYPDSSSRVLVATNLRPPILWQPIATNIAPSAGVWQFTDTNATRYPVRLYRSSTP